MNNTGLRPFMVGPGSDVFEAARVAAVVGNLQQQGQHHLNLQTSNVSSMTNVNALPNVSGLTSSNGLGTFALQPSGLFPSTDLALLSQFGQIFPQFNNDQNQSLQHAGQLAQGNSAAALKLNSLADAEAFRQLQQRGGSGRPTRSSDSRTSSAYASRHQAAEQRRRTRINERYAGFQSFLSQVTQRKQVISQKRAEVTRSFYSQARFAA